MTKCDPITRAQCPHAAYCEPFAVYTDESECAKFAEWVSNKPVTNADRIRAMSDKELASFMADRYAKESILRVREEGCEPTATQISALHEALHRTWLNWLRQPAEVG